MAAATVRRAQVRRALYKTVEAQRRYTVANELQEDHGRERREQKKTISEYERIHEEFDRLATNEASGEHLVKHLV